MWLVSKNKVLLNIIMVTLASIGAHGQSAEIIYNSAAEKYVHGERDNARDIVEEGLRKFPNDEYLEGLLALLNQEDKDSQDSEKSDSEDGEENEEDKQDGDNQDSEEDEQKEDKPKDGDQNEDGQEEAEPKPIQLTPREAEQLLEAAKNEDQKIQLQLKKKQKGDPRKIEKDW